MKKNACRTHSPEATKKIAAGIAKDLRAGDLLALTGDLGSGKTCFVQGLAQGLKIPKNILISSPTFVLLQEYPGGRLPLYHFDFYRLERIEQAMELGPEEIWDGDGVTVVEWADKFAKLFPKRTRWLRFRFVDELTREIEC